MNSTQYKATAVFATYNVGVNKSEQVFDTFDEAQDWLESQCAEYETTTGLNDFYSNGSKIEEL